ncbi:TPA: restriction endonuclease subunit S [Enterococcus faecium]
MSNDARPEIRFPGFTDDWEQRKLGDETKILAGGDVDKTKLKENGKYPVLANALTNDGIVGYYDDDFRIKAPAVTVTGRGDVGYAQARRVNFTPVVRLLSVKSKHDVDFLENSINNHKVLVESTGVPQLTAPQLGNYKIFFPTIEEETKIGSLFKKLDTAINIHQRELDLLKETKKGFLQKMFPKNGAKVPEIRFSGFTEDWEQRKLSEIAEFNPKSNLPDRFEYVDLESVIGTKMIYHRTENKVSAPSRAQRLAQKGDVFYQTVRPYQKNNYLFDLPFNNYVFSTGYAQMRPKNNSYFLLTLLQEEKFVNRVLERSTGTSYPAINSNDLAKISVDVPIENKEEVKIGMFFKQLDDTIALHQRKLDLLKETKKGFLQKMFV